jgi:SAM-dependent methyltransferase
VALSKRPATPSYDADYYAANDQGGDRLALWFYARLASRLAPPGASVLDFGCGTGHLSRRLSRRFSCLAYDASPYARERTAIVAPAAQVVEDVGALEPTSLDLVCSLHVLEHVPAPSATFHEITAVLKPDGRFMFVVPNPEGWGHRIKRGDWFAYRDPTHCSLLSRDQWLEEARRGGLTIEAVHADGLWDVPYVARIPAWLQRPVAGLPGALQVALGRSFLPADWGECIIVVARRPA